jgi:GNAT superfamily N-acetyltransferase
VRSISAAETVEVRWPILRPGFPRESAIFQGDELATTHHLGAFAEEAMLGVASIYLAPLPEEGTTTPAYQLRGMAVLDSAQGQGCGAALLGATVAKARELGAVLLWCNARITAAKFYRRHGFQTVGDEFDIPTVGPHYRMFLPL